MRCYSQTSAVLHNPKKSLVWQWKSRHKERDNNPFAWNVIPLMCIVQCWPGLDCHKSSAEGGLQLLRKQHENSTWRFLACEKCSSAIQALKQYNVQRVPYIVNFKSFRSVFFNLLDDEALFSTLYFSAARRPNSNSHPGDSNPLGVQRAIKEWMA